MTDRIAAGALIALSAAYIVLAAQIEITFFTDPLGAKWFPIMVGVFLIGSCVALLFRPVTATEWPDTSTWGRLALCLAGFVGYALALVPLGFILATTLAYTLFAMLFRANFWRSLLAGAIFAVASYVLFQMALDLYLPTGRLFQGWF